MGIAQELTAQYLARAGQAGMRADSAIYRFQLAALRETLTRLEIVMEDEGLPAGMVERVIRAMLYGSPSPAVAGLVKAMADETLTMLEKIPAGMPVTSAPWQH
jgi:hypothetical protein